MSGSTDWVEGLGDWGLAWFSWCGDGIPEMCAAAILSSIKSQRELIVSLLHRGKVLLLSQAFVYQVQLR